LQRKVERIARGLSQTISSWPGTEAIVLGQASEEEVLDPYFTIALEVYRREPLPTEAQRRRLLGNPPSFDSVTAFSEDRFLSEELPVKIRYQETARFDQLVERIDRRLWVFHDAGTYLLYRVLQGKALFQRSSWLDELRGRLGELPEHFWRTIIDGARPAVAYYLNDLRAAVSRGGSLFYLFSLSHFLSSLCSFLFAVNRTFEPSSRVMEERVKKLALLPDGFAGRFESLLRDDPELPADRKTEVAELLAKSSLAMA
jgi:hypothetical protein